MHSSNQIELFFGAATGSAKRTFPLYMLITIWAIFSPSIVTYFMPSSWARIEAPTPELPAPTMRTSSTAGSGCGSLSSALIFSTTSTPRFKPSLMRGVPATSPTR